MDVQNYPQSWTQGPMSPTDSNWRDRLAKAIEDNGLNPTQVSLKAGLSHGYVHSILNPPRSGKRPSDPTSEKLGKICAVLGVSRSWIEEGVEITAEAEELRLVASRLTREQVDLLRRLAEGMIRQ